ncbi:MAG: hypothetical protein FJ387_01445 [Verrucomicrobia bacterium]|nr:hypothetical protein [Verrucomicrobiota bacterium]
MAAASPKKQLALDANLLFDLAEERDFALEFREVFQDRGYRLFLPPTALHELHTICLEAVNQQPRQVRPLHGWERERLFDQSEIRQGHGRKLAADRMRRARSFGCGVAAL